MIDNRETTVEQADGAAGPVVPYWRKSSYSQGQSACVETATNIPGGEVWVRDSKNPDGAVLRFTSAEWKAFVAGARDGEFGA